ncbi:MAG: T9SS type A sorting domain-containing protein, partial [Bacteroidales bacterium]|nr:T9SS type A sorting domain-containing protein [Bacteroidales bacterium]
GSFSFVPVDGDDVYVVMTSSLGCVTAATAMSNTVTITVTAVILPPAAFNVTGGGAYCQGTGGLLVGLDGSEVCVTYTLTPGGATVAGTGAAVSFGSQLAGTYTATGSNGTFTTNMIGSAVITENPLPGPAGAISGLATVTEGTSGVAYSVVIPNATAAYWSYSGTGYVINGNGSASVAIDFAVGATSGTLSVFGQNDCGISGSVTLDITVDEIVVLIPVAATWNGSVNEDWFEGGNWTTEVGAVVPAATTTVLIPGGLTTYPTLTAPASCASFTINDGGSFIGSEFLTASSVLVKRDITNTKAHFLSTPVSGTTIGGVFSNSLTVWAREYVALSGTWVFRYLTDPFVVGKGYNVSTTTPTVTANFVGALNTPPVFAGALSTANGGWNLLGNPYTSAIDWDGVVLNNVSASVAVWDGFNILGAPTAGYRYYSSSTGIGTFGFTGIIPAENGFFVTATGASASIDMPAATRVHSTAPFFKGSLANVLRVNVAGNSLNDETVIHFENAATANFDNFDGKKLDSDASLFSVVNGDRLWLNSFPLEGNEVVDLGFKANADGEYTFTASGIESFDGFTPVLLEDLKLNKVQDLRQNANYSFSYVNGDSENRFKLHFKNANGMSDLNTTGISVYSLDKSVVINNNTQLAGEVWIYDVTGRELIHTSMSSDAKTIIPVKAPTANYMVKVVTANGSVNQKVFIR